MVGLSPKEYDLSTKCGTESGAALKFLDGLRQIETETNPIFYLRQDIYIM